MLTASALNVGLAGSIILLILGLVMIVKGGDFFVDAASWIAEVSGIPPLLVGATVVSVATTLPELIVSVMATAQGSIEIATGNAVGSVVANTGLIMAISLMFLPSKINLKEYMFKSILLLAAVANLWLCCIGGSLSVWVGIIIFELFILFVLENVKEAITAMRTPLNTLSADTNPASESANIAKNVSANSAENAKNANSTKNVDNSEENNVKKDKKTIIINVIEFIVGAIGIVGGADLLVTYGQDLAIRAGVPEGIIAVTLVAIGTSLPELVTTITALVKKKASLSVGNIIGANVLDMTMILPICAMVSGGKLIVPTEALTLDLPFCMGLSAIAIIPMFIGKRFYRWQGFTLIACYAAYLTLRIIFTGI